MTILESLLSNQQLLPLSALSLRSSASYMQCICAWKRCSILSFFLGRLGILAGLWTANAAGIFFPLNNSLITCPRFEVIKAYLASSCDQLTSSSVHILASRSSSSVLLLGFLACNHDTSVLWMVNCHHCPGAFTLVLMLILILLNAFQLIRFSMTIEAPFWSTSFCMSSLISFSSRFLSIFCSLLGGFLHVCSGGFSQNFLNWLSKLLSSLHLSRLKPGEGTLVPLKETMGFFWLHFYMGKQNSEFGIWYCVLCIFVGCIAAFLLGVNFIMLQHLVLWDVFLRDAIGGWNSDIWWGTLEALL